MEAVQEWEEGHGTRPMMRGGAGVGKRTLNKASDGVVLGKGGELRTGPVKRVDLE